MPALFQRKLPSRTIHVMLPLVITFCMTFIVSGISTVKTIGFDSPDLMRLWMKAWGTSWVIAFPTLLIILPFIKKFVGLFVESA